MVKNRLKNGAKVDLELSEILNINRSALKRPPFGPEFSDSHQNWREPSMGCVLQDFDEHFATRPRNLPSLTEIVVKLSEIVGNCVEVQIQRVERA